MKKSFLGVTLFLLLSTIGANSQTLQQRDSQYMTLCTEWSQARTDSEALTEVLYRFLAFSDENRGNIYGVRSLVNIAQIYEAQQLHYRAANTYKAALRRLQSEQAQYEPAFQDMATTYGSNILVNLAGLYSQQDNTTGTLEAVGLAVQEYPEGLFTPRILDAVYQNTDFDLAESREAYFQATQTIATRYTGKHRSKLLKEAVSSSLYLAQRGKVSTEETIVSLQKLAAAMDEEEKTITNVATAETRLLDTLVNKKTENLQYLSIDDLPRMD